MGSGQARSTAAIIETGLEPEYLITDIVRAESVAGGVIRLYFATKKQKSLVMQFTVVASPADFLRMAKQVQAMSADQHNLEMWEIFLGGENGH